MSDLDPVRRPAAPVAPGYPTWLELAPDRRRALKLFALSAAGAVLGLPLTGCPGAGTTSTPPPPPPPPPAQPPSWLPWRDPAPNMRMAGEVAAPMPARVAVVLGGGPVEVTLQGGERARLVVAAVVTHDGGASPHTRAQQRAAADAELIRAAAATLAPSALADVAALDTFEDRLLQALAPVWPGPLEEVTVGLAVEGGDEPLVPARDEAPRAREAAQELAPPREAEEAAQKEERAREPEPARDEVAPVAVPRAAASQAPRADALWAPCRRPGCTSCGR